MGTNIVLLLAVIIMIAIWIWLFRDGEGRARPGRFPGKARDAIPGAQIRIRAEAPEDRAAEQSDKP
jgi:hypothetical protein